MKFISVLTLIAGLVSAVPVEVEVQALSEREVQAAEVQAQFLFRNELEDGNPSKCPKAILIFARGSTEPGNMVRVVVPKFDPASLTQSFHRDSRLVQS